MRHFISSLLLVPAVTTGVFAQDPKTKELPTARLPGAPGRAGFNATSFDFGPQLVDNRLLKLPRHAALPEAVWIRTGVTTTGKVAVLPIYLLAKLDIERHGATEQAIKVTIHDPMYDQDTRPALIEALDDAFRDEKSKKSRWEEVSPSKPRIEVTLVMRDRKGEVRFGSASVTRTPHDSEYTFEFPLPPEIAVQVDKGDYKNLSLVIRETYSGEFTERDLRATVGLMAEATSKFRTIIGSAPDAGVATHFLVPLNNEVGNETAIRSFLTRFVEIEVRSNADKPANQGLLKECVDKLWDQARVELALNDKEVDRVATFLLANEVTVTATLGNFQKLSKYLKSEVEKKDHLKWIKSWSGKADTGVEVPSKLKFTFAGQGARNDETIDDRYLKTLLEVLDSFEGNIKVPCLSVSQLQKALDNRNFFQTIDLKQFVTGQFVVESYRPLNELSKLKLATLKKKLDELEKTAMTEKRRLAHLAIQQDGDSSLDSECRKNIQSALADLDRYLETVQEQKRNLQPMLPNGEVPTLKGELVVYKSHGWTDMATHWDNGNGANTTWAMIGSAPRVEFALAFIDFNKPVLLSKDGKTWQFKLDKKSLYTWMMFGRAVMNKEHKTGLAIVTALRDPAKTIKGGEDFHYPWAAAFEKYAERTGKGWNDFRLRGFQAREAGCKYKLKFTTVLGREVEAEFDNCADLVK